MEIRYKLYIFTSEQIWKLREFEVLIRKNIFEVISACNG